MLLYSDWVTPNPDMRASALFCAAGDSAYHFVWPCSRSAVRSRMRQGSTPILSFMIAFRAALRDKVALSKREICVAKKNTPMDTLAQNDTVPISSR